MFNVIYADDKGNIFYLFAGNIPVRAEGNWQFWHGMVNGSDSKYIWHKTLPYTALPKLLNPATGFIQNANDPPWTCTYRPVLQPERFPGYLSPQGMALRPQRAVNMIKNDSLVTPSGLAAYKLNTGMEAADRFLPDLLAAVNRFPDTMAIKAVAVLRSWDRATNLDSRGAVLFTRWFDKITPEMFLRQWTPNHVGDVYRFRLGVFDLPANGGTMLRNPEASIGETSCHSWSEKYCGRHGCRGRKLKKMQKRSTDSDQYSLIKLNSIVWFFSRH